MKEDKIGEDTLITISEAEKFNNWMFKTISPYCSGKILEIGSGHGNISQFFINHNYNITLSDFNEKYCVFLSDNYSNKVINLDIINPNFDIDYKEYFNSFDTIFALNVIEHIENDTLAIMNIAKLLKKGGNMLILVPAYQNLYTSFDKELGHFRRYTAKTAKKILTENYLKIKHTQYFNFMGIIGWYISSKIQKNSIIPKKQMNLYNYMVPLFKIIDKLVFNHIGLSTIVVGEKV